MQKTLLITACVLGAAAVVTGAFGAHGLKGRLTPDELQIFETGVKYQFYHVFAILAAVLLMYKIPSSVIGFAGIAFIAGIFLFSGSLYLLACKELLHIQHGKWLGPVTPIGGMAFIAGWALLLGGVLRKT